MKKILLSALLIFLATINGSGQEAVHNFGNLKIHQDGALGFHHDLINDGFTDENEGLAGFYSGNSILISGAFRPIFQDLEIVVTDYLFLDIGVGVTNNSNFVIGDVVTPRNLMDVNLEYQNQAFYNGETDANKVDGYAAIINKQNFTFPIGNNQRLRPLVLASTNINNSAKSAYFEENPNFPSTFGGSFDTEERADILIAVSQEEFWDLDSNILSKVTLTWDAQSNLPSFLDEFENLRVVGWNTTDALWEDLGTSNLNGTFTSGTITSDVFMPDDYSVITFGGSLSKESITLADYLLTPNGDGINDFLELKAVSLSPNNQLQIFNRWGRAVYIAEDYSNLFDGKANVKGVFQKNKKLPAGVYFYIINLFDIDIVHQGYLYIEQ